MDYELLFALFILWTATSTCLALFLLILINNDGGAFHPHCVDVESRHLGFIVVKSCTSCKQDCAVKSISAFIAPRGSSSSKYFGSIIVIISVAGMFGSFRWYMIGDADETQAVLAVIGFSFLLLICAFESDVSPDRFLEDKLMVTAWFLERIGAESLLDFPLEERSGAYRYWVRTSPHLRPLFEEFDRDEALGANLGRDAFQADKDFPYRPWWTVMHVVGALGYLGCVAASIILNDIDDTDIYGVAYVMSASFALFSIMGYLTGTYLPLLRPLRGIVLVWNPFCRDRNYMTSLREAVLLYKLADAKAYIKDISSEDGQSSKTLRRRSARLVSYLNQSSPVETKKGVSRRASELAQYKAELIKIMKENETTVENSNFLLRPFLRYIEQEPDKYLRNTSYLFVFLELVAMLTPAVAIGLQWATALCPGSPMQSILELINSSYRCFYLSSEACEVMMRSHCIVQG